MTHFERVRLEHVRARKIEDFLQSTGVNPMEKNSITVKSSTKGCRFQEWSMTTGHHS